VFKAIRGRDGFTRDFGCGRYENLSGAISWLTFFAGGAADVRRSQRDWGGNSENDLAAAVRKGGAVISEEGVVAPEHPIWVKFAPAMAPMMATPSQLMAKLVDEKADRNLKIRLCKKQSAGFPGIL
jgi:hypothetical protein